tara:strand:+ start:138 stop:473 length:336 start_codon:yes stop_codon:yes gene_type:complete
MNIRDITEGPGWNAFKQGVGGGADNLMKGVAKSSGKDMSVMPSQATPSIVGTTVAGWKGKTGKDDKDKEPDQNLAYLKQQSAIMKDKKLTPEQKLQKLDQLLQQQIQQAGR